MRGAADGAGGWTRDDAVVPPRATRARMRKGDARGVAKARGERATRDDGGLTRDAIDRRVGAGIHTRVSGVESGAPRGAVRRVRRGVEIRGATRRGGIRGDLRGRERGGAIECDRCAVRGARGDGSGRRVERGARGVLGKVAG